ncbi:hypothetical protein IAI10_16420 [Clostridium sp. 19966]|uniref:hypothetical protein n=1 Tax=Clostridium sp. 19966 TaxID=2768166 RepID=UPI0028DD9538|nr:hypothetical protein [Clostridium sp. 19966]MDT8718253.1 hypothetical protein [Clostridium sp. 19966]
MDIKSTYREILKNLEVGDMLYWKKQKQPFYIKARNKRYIILTRNLFGKIENSIIDFQELAYGSDDFFFKKYDYTNKEDINRSLQDLEQGIYEVVYRKITDFEKCFDRFCKKNNRNMVGFQQQGAVIRSINDKIIEDTLDLAYGQFKEKVEKTMAAK